MPREKRIHRESEKLNSGNLEGTLLPKSPTNPGKLSLSPSESSKKEDTEQKNHPKQLLDTSDATTSLNANILESRKKCKFPSNTELDNEENGVSEISGCQAISLPLLSQVLVRMGFPATAEALSLEIGNKKSEKAYANNSSSLVSNSPQVTLGERTNEQPSSRNHSQAEIQDKVVCPSSGRQKYSDNADLSLFYRTVAIASDDNRGDSGIERLDASIIQSLAELVVDGLLDHHSEKFSDGSNATLTNGNKNGDTLIEVLKMFSKMAQECLHIIFPSPRKLTEKIEELFFSLCRILWEQQQLAEVVVASVMGYCNSMALERHAEAISFSTLLQFRIQQLLLTLEVDLAELDPCPCTSDPGSAKAIRLKHLLTNLIRSLRKFIPIWQENVELILQWCLKYVPTASQPSNPGASLFSKIGTSGSSPDQIQWLAFLSELKEIAEGTLDRTSRGEGIPNLSGFESAVVGKGDVINLFGSNPQASETIIAFLLTSRARLVHWMIISLEQIFLACGSEKYENILSDSDLVSDSRASSGHHIQNFFSFLLGSWYTSCSSSLTTYVEKGGKENQLSPAACPCKVSQIADMFRSNATLLLVESDFACRESRKSESFLQTLFLNLATPFHSDETASVVRNLKSCNGANQDAAEDKNDRSDTNRIDKKDSLYRSLAGLRLFLPDKNEKISIPLRSQLSRALSRPYRLLDLQGVEKIMPLGVQLRSLADNTIGVNSSVCGFGANNDARAGQCGLSSTRLPFRRLCREDTESSCDSSKRKEKPMPSASNKENKIGDSSAPRTKESDLATDKLSTTSPSHNFISSAANLSDLQEDSTATIHQLVEAIVNYCEIAETNISLSSNNSENSLGSEDQESEEAPSENSRTEELNEETSRSHDSGRLTSTQCLFNNPEDRITFEVQSVAVTSCGRLLAMLMNVGRLIMYALKDTQSESSGYQEKLLLDTILPGIPPHEKLFQYLQVSSFLHFSPDGRFLLCSLQFYPNAVPEGEEAHRQIPENNGCVYIYSCHREEDPEELHCTDRSTKSDTKQTSNRVNEARPSDPIKRETMKIFRCTPERLYACYKIHNKPVVTARWMNPLYWGEMKTYSSISESPDENQVLFSSTFQRQSDNQEISTRRPDLRKWVVAARKKLSLFQCLSSGLSNQIIRWIPSNGIILQTIATHPIQDLIVSPLMQAFYTIGDNGTLVMYDAWNERDIASADEGCIYMSSRGLPASYSILHTEVPAQAAGEAENVPLTDKEYPEAFFNGTHSIGFDRSTTTQRGAINEPFNQHLNQMMRDKGCPSLGNPESKAATFWGRHLINQLLREGDHATGDLEMQFPSSEENDYEDDHNDNEEEDHKKEGNHGYSGNEACSTRPGTSVRCNRCALSSVTLAGDLDSYTSQLSPLQRYKKNFSHHTHIGNPQKAARRRHGNILKNKAHPRFPHLPQILYKSGFRLIFRDELENSLYRAANLGPIDNYGTKRNPMYHLLSISPSGEPRWNEFNEAKFSGSDSVPQANSVSYYCAPQSSSTDRGLHVSSGFGVSEVYDDTVRFHIQKKSSNNGLCPCSSNGRYLCIMASVGPHRASKDDGIPSEYQPGIYVCLVFDAYCGEVVRSIPVCPILPALSLTKNGLIPSHNFSRKAPIYCLNCAVTTVPKNTGGKPVKKCHTNDESNYPSEEKVIVSVGGLCERVFVYDALSGDRITVWNLDSTAKAKSKNRTDSADSILATKASANTQGITSNTTSSFKRARFQKSGTRIPASSGFSPSEAETGQNFFKQSAENLNIWLAEGSETSASETSCIFDEELSVGGAPISSRWIIEGDAEQGNVPNGNRAESLSNTLSRRDLHKVSEQAPHLKKKALVSEDGNVIKSSITGSLLSQYSLLVHQLERIYGISSVIHAQLSLLEVIPTFPLFCSTESVEKAFIHKITPFLDLFVQRTSEAVSTDNRHSISLSCSDSHNSIGHDFPFQNAPYQRQEQQFVAEELKRRGLELVELDSEKETLSKVYEEKVSSSDSGLHSDNRIQNLRFNSVRLRKVSGVTNSSKKEKNSNSPYEEKTKETQEDGNTSFRCGVVNAVISWYDSDKQGFFSIASSEYGKVTFSGGILRS